MSILKHNCYDMFLAELAVNNKLYMEIMKKFVEENGRKLFLLF